jgi:hypothetical protein
MQTETRNSNFIFGHSFSSKTIVSAIHYSLTTSLTSNCSNLKLRSVLVENKYQKEPNAFKRRNDLYVEYNIDLILITEEWMATIYG